MRRRCCMCHGSRSLTSFNSPTRWTQRTRSMKRGVRRPLLADFGSCKALVLHADVGSVSLFFESEALDCQVPALCHEHRHISHAWRV